MGKNRSPLKAKPLRQAGASVQERIFDVVCFGMLMPLLVVVVSVASAVMEWIRYLQDAPPSPYPVSLVALLTMLYALFQVPRSLAKIRRLRLGRDGEKAVGEYLERLREQGAHVFHDCPGDKFNLDHVVVHASGIYVIETKTWLLPKAGNPVIEYKDGKISIAGRHPHRDPVVRVKAVANWLRELLQESTGRNFAARGVVLFPGWYIKVAGNNGDSPVWVLNPKALLKFITHQRERLRSEDVKLATFHLSRYIHANAYS